MDRTDRPKRCGGAPRVHGGVATAELRALGLHPSGVIDFSVNTNCYGPSPAVLEAVRRAAIDRYPDPAALEARETIARARGVHALEVVLGHGATDLLWTLARVILGTGRAVVIAAPTFSEFGAAAEAAGAKLFEWRASREAAFAVDPAGLGDLLTRTGADALSLCNPNNPTGASVPAAVLADLARAHPGTTFVLDESYLSLSDRASDARAPMPSNVARVRSLTKDHAIPGLRVGYLIASAELAARIEAARPAWATSAPAQAAAVAAMGEEAFVEESRRRLLADRDRMITALRDLGLRPLPSSAPFFLTPVGDAARLRARLLRHGIAVRDCASFGLPGFIRLCARPAADAGRLVDALRAERHP